MNVIDRFHVTEQGAGQPMVFAHGFGCDQSMWRLVAPGFAKDHRVILYDLAGAGKAHPSAYDKARHSTLQGYARDLLELVLELDLKDVIFVGHSVSAMIGVLAAIERPDRFAKLVLVGPSPSYLNDGDYVGGFGRGDIDGLIDAVDSNYLGWASAMAPVIMDNADRPELSAELKNSFCKMDPEIARNFARATFLSDHRADLSRVKTPSLILQVSNDVIAPVKVGEYMKAKMPRSRLTILKARGHCPHLSVPGPTIAAIRDYLQAA